MVEDRGPTVLTVTCFVIVLSTLFVLLRFVSRIFFVRQVSSDDYCMAAAWIMALGLSLAIMIGTTRGLGRHDADIPDDWNFLLRRSEYVFSVLYNPALMVSKTSILIFYLRLTKTKKFFRIASAVVLVVAVVAGTALTLLNIFQCRPVANTFDSPLSPDTLCIDIVTLYLSSAPVNILTDLAILFLPMPILTALCLPRKQKIILIATFGLGGFVTIVDVVRIAYLQQAALSRLLAYSGQGTNVRGSNTATQHDFAWYASLSFMWSAVEVNVGIICACIPTLRPVISFLLPRFLGDSQESPGAYSGQPHSGAVDNTNAPSISRKAKLRSNSQVRLTSSSRPSSSPSDTLNELKHINYVSESGKGFELADLGGLSHQTSVVVTRPFPDPPRLRAPFVLNHSAERKSMVKMTSKEARGSFILVTLLVFLWGFAYGLLNALNAHFQAVINITPAQAVALHASYFTAYFVSPITFGYIIFEKFGFKITFITGLCIYSTGALMFWPSAVLTSFSGFIISTFTVSLGLSTLEIAANPFIALCGPPEHGESRLNLAQAFQGFGAVLSSLMATFALFKGVDDASSLIDAQWTYLAVALFVAFLAVVFYYYPLPEASAEDLEETWGARPEVSSAKIFGLPLPIVTLALGTFAQFCCVGAQEGLSWVFSTLVSQFRPWTTSQETVYFSAIAYALFSLGRFVAAGASYFLHIKPRYILFFLTAGALATSTYSMLAGGTAALATLLLVYFFEATTWPTIYVMAMRGQGKRIKLTSAFLVASVVSGSFLPAGQYGIENIDTVQHALGIAVACFACILFLPIFTTMSRSARNLIDPEHYSTNRSDLPGKTSSNDPNWVGRYKNKSLPSFGDTEEAGRHITVERSVQVERSV